MKIVVAAGAVAFVAITALYFFFNSMGVVLFNPQLYPYALHAPASGAGQVTDYLSALYAFVFVFTAGLLFYGWLGVAAMAAEAAKYSNLLLSQGMALGQFLFAIPLLMALASATLLLDATSSKGVARRKGLRNSAIVFVLGVALTLGIAFVMG